MMDPPWLAEAEELRRLAPRHVLFLCTANSARSQLAEGLARALAPAVVRISSAGWRPTWLDPMAVRVLAEIGIDITHQHAKAIEDLAPADAEVVVVLSGEEDWPPQLARAQRVRWPLPDPVGRAGSEADQLAPFREVRDELRRRLAVVFRR